MWTVIGIAAGLFAAYMIWYKIKEWRELGS